MLRCSAYKECKYRKCVHIRIHNYLDTSCVHNCKNNTSGLNASDICTELTPNEYKLHKLKKVI